MNKVNSLVWRNMINEGIWMVGIGISRGGGRWKIRSKAGRANRKRYAHIFIKEKLQHIQGGYRILFFFFRFPLPSKKKTRIHSSHPSIHPHQTLAKTQHREKASKPFFPLLPPLFAYTPSPLPHSRLLLGCSGYRWFWYDCA